MNANETMNHPYGSGEQAAINTAGMPINEQIEMLQRMGTELGHAYDMINNLRVKADAYDVLCIAVRKSAGGGAEVALTGSGLPQQALRKADELQDRMKAHKEAVLRNIDQQRADRMAADVAELAEKAERDAKRAARAKKRAKTIAAKKAAAELTAQVAADTGAVKVVRKPRAARKPRVVDPMEAGLGAALTSNLLDSATA